MREESRVKRWRDTKRQHGLKAVTIWLTLEEERCLKDLALQWHCSPSAVMQRALAQITAPLPPQPCSPPDTLLIRELIRAELAAMQATQTSVTVGSTVTPTETLTIETPADSATGLHTGTPAQFQAHDDQRDVTETVAVTEPHKQVRAYGEVPAAVLAALAQRQPATAAELAKALGDHTKAGTKRIWQALQRLLGSGKVLQEGKQYRLPASQPQAPAPLRSVSQPLDEKDL